MDKFAKNDIKKWKDDEEVVKRIKEFISMDGAAFFEEVRSHLSPQELEEYLEENPDERVYMENSKKERPVK